ncbi:hypothetical protein D3C78_874460 [compost metagenome]
MPVTDRFGVEMFRHLRIVRPLFHCLADQPAVFKDTAEIDMAGSELRIGLQTGAECLYGARAVAELAERDGIVEIGKMNDGIVVVECDPGLVEFHSSGSLAGSIERLGHAQQIHET